MSRRAFSQRPKPVAGKGQGLCVFGGEEETVTSCLLAEAQKAAALVLAPTGVCNAGFR